MIEPDYRSGKEKDAPRPLSRNARLTITALIVGGLLMAVVLIVHYRRRSELANVIINGLRPVEIGSIHIRGQQMDIRCEGKPTIDYFNQCLNRPRILAVGGIAWTWEVTMRDGSTTTITACVTPDGHVTLFPRDGEVGCGLDMVQPMPADVDRLLKLLAAPVGGKAAF